MYIYLCSSQIIYICMYVCDDYHSGGEPGGRWSGKPKRGGMTGVGVGASPAFRSASSSSSGGGGSNGGGGGGGGGERSTKGTQISLERSLLSEAVSQPSVPRVCRD